MPDSADIPDIADLRQRLDQAVVRQDWPLAEQTARQLDELGVASRADLLHLAHAWRWLGRFDEAIELLDRLRPGADDAERRQLYDVMATVLMKVGRHEEAADRLKEALQAGADAVLMERLANLLARENPQEALVLARRAVELDPTRLSARALIRASAERPGAARPRPPIARMPKRVGQFADARQAIRDSVLGGYPRGERFIDASTRFVTLGSCFADNLARHLTAKGLNAFSENIGEDVNSTFANRYLLDWVRNGVSSDTTQMMQDAYGEELRGRMREALAACDVFVFSLGVAPCFFDPDTDEFFFVNPKAGAAINLILGRYKMRTTTVQENAENLAAIISTVNALAHRPPTVVLTVSPVPLSATTESESALISDCLSKSTLRLACEEVLRANAGGQVHYWPSFEMVRWAGPYLAAHNPPVFGADDDRSRHVSRWLVALIMDLFLETYGKVGIGELAPQA